MYTLDNTNPSIVEFVFDINSDSVILTFDEPVRKSTLQLTSIQMFSTNSSTNAGDFGITLSGGEIVDSSTELCTVVTVIFERLDIEEVKGNSSIGVNINNTYVALGQEAIADRQGNLLQATDRLQASDVIPDTTRPQLVSFKFDIESGEMVLTFNDVVDVSTFDATAFTVQNDGYNLGEYTETYSSSGYVITVDVSPEDLVSIKLTSGLASSMENTYIIMMQAYAIDDISGEGVSAITDGKALQASEYIEDQAPPEINNFDLDLNASKLTIYFNEAINASSLQPTLVYVYSNQNGDSEHQLNGYENVETIDDSTTLVVYLIREDSNALKASTLLATLPDNT